MQQCAELETAAGRKEEWCPEEEDAICDLQCGDSLALAVNNRIGEEGFRVKQWLRSFRGLQRRRHSS